VLGISVSSRREVVPARRFELQTIGLKVDLREVHRAPLKAAECHSEYNLQSPESTAFRRVTQKSVL